MFTRDDENIKVKVQKHPDASSIDILDDIKAGLRKAPEQIIIYVGTNDTSKDTNYLKNVKKIWWKKSANIPNLNSPQWFVALILKMLMALSIPQILVQKTIANSKTQ